MATVQSLLIVSFVLLALLPAFACGTVWVVAGPTNARQCAIDQLGSVATLAAAWLAILVVVFSFNVLGDGLRVALDLRPKVQ